MCEQQINLLWLCITTDPFCWSSATFSFAVKGIYTSLVHVQRGRSKNCRLHQVILIRRYVQSAWTLSEMPRKTQRGRKPFIVKASATPGFTGSVQIFRKHFTKLIKTEMIHFTAPTVVWLSVNNNSMSWSLSLKVLKKDLEVQNLKAENPKSKETVNVTQTDHIWSTTNFIKTFC